MGTFFVLVKKPATKQSMKAVRGRREAIKASSEFMEVKDGQGCTDTRRVTDTVSKLSALQAEWTKLCCGADRRREGGLQCGLRLINACGLLNLLRKSPVPGLQTATRGLKPFREQVAPFIKPGWRRFQIQTLEIIRARAFQVIS